MPSPKRSPELRRPARSQPLPPEEVNILSHLTNYDLELRCKALYDAGWTLRAIGEALSPPRSRSTIHIWVERSTPPAPPTPTPPTRVPSPEYRTEATYTRKTPPTTPIDPADRAQIARLAPISRKYRSSLSPRHPASQANDQLTYLCKALYDTGVSINDLAVAAGVTYRAMWKRIHL